MKPQVCLNDLQPGQQAIVQELRSTGSIRRRLLDMGLIPRTAVKLMKVAPMGDPIEIRVRGYELTLRVEDAMKIQVKEAAA